MSEKTSSLQAVRDELRRLPAPVILFNKSHSGSRLLARLVEKGGFFMGAHQNESRDSLDVLRLVEYLVEKYYPDYQSLWSEEGANDVDLVVLIRDVFNSHLQGSAAGGRWGWKLCETAYILPVLDFLFPKARYLHLLRDGRDVAFCNHASPEKPFWRKVYFNTDRLETWRGLRLDHRAYEERSHLYNALHWVNSVSVGRAYGAMLRERYLEIRYEDLCYAFDFQARRIFNFIQAPDGGTALPGLKKEVYQRSLAKHLIEPAWKLREVLKIEKPLLLSLGYLAEDPDPPPPRSLRRRIKTLFRKPRPKTPAR